MAIRRLSKTDAEPIAARLPGADLTAVRAAQEAGRTIAASDDEGRIVRVNFADGYMEVTWLTSHGEPFLELTDLAAFAFREAITERPETFDWNVRAEFVIDGERVAQKYRDYITGLVGFCGGEGRRIEFPMGKVLRAYEKVRTR